MTYRLFIFGPTYSIWIRVLEKYIVMRTRRATVLAKIAADQLLWALPSLTLLYCSMTLLEGGTLRQGFERAKDMLLPTWTLGCVWWTAVQSITFGIVPVQHRVGFVSVAQIVSNTWISGMNEYSKRREEQIISGVDSEGGGGVRGVSITDEFLDVLRRVSSGPSPSVASQSVANLDGASGDCAQQHMTHKGLHLASDESIGTVRSTLFER
jgi:hypothetical protein